MSLYYEVADILTAPTNAGGSLKSRIFSRKDLKYHPAQIYALAIETCKWSPVLKEVIENADLLCLERKLTPILSLLLVHDLLQAKRGIALPATHGLRAAVERHKGRLQAELTKARIRRKLSTMEALKAHIELGQENAADNSEAPYPRWIRINTLKTTLEDQMDTTFKGCERALSISSVRQRDFKRLYIDDTIPNLIAVSPSIDLSKSPAYKSGTIIFQDKASCFPAYLLDPFPQDGNIIDTCSAPGNKTTHIAAIMIARNTDPEECEQTIHAFEKNKGRAETLEKMVNLAGSDGWTKIHPGQDFLKTDPNSSVYKEVGALLLDPSCSGSGIVGRDDMPELHLPVLKQGGPQESKGFKKGNKKPDPAKETRKRKRDGPKEELGVMVDDDGVVTAVDTDAELKARLTALSTFQLDLLLHAFKFPAAHKITYSTCSIHAEENELVVQRALVSDIAKERGWRILKREDQVRGLEEWPVRGSREACGEDDILAEACIRANKGDEHGTMGFFLAGFVRDQKPIDLATLDAQFLRDEDGHMVRDMMGIPVIISPEEPSTSTEEDFEMDTKPPASQEEEEEEWGGFEDDTLESVEETSQESMKQEETHSSSNQATKRSGRRPELRIKEKKRRKGKKTG